MDNNMNNYSGGPGSGNRPGNNGGNGPGGNGGNNGQPPKRQSLLFLLIACLVTLLFMSYFMKAITGGTS